MRADEVDGMEVTRARVSDSFWPAFLLVMLCLMLLIAFATVVLKDAREGSEHQRTSAPLSTMHDMSVPEEDFRAILWLRLMDQCVEREPEYACILKVERAVEAAVTARRKFPVLRGGSGGQDGI